MDKTIFNPKEKAKELIEKFLRIEDDTTFYWEPYYDTRCMDEEVLPHAKKCAILVCAEMINQSKELKLADHILFWENVKNEVQ